MECNGCKKIGMKLNKLAKNMDNLITDALMFSASIVRGKAKEYAPVDTGTLRRSITSTNVSKTTKGYEIKVGTNIEYAPYQEYGTGIYVGRGYIYPKRARFLSWVTKDGKRVFARRVRGVKGKHYFKKGVKYLMDHIGLIKNKIRSNMWRYW